MITKKRSHRIIAVILSSILTIYTLQMSITAAEAPSDEAVSEEQIVEEDPVEEVISNDADAEETGDYETDPDEIEVTEEAGAEVADGEELTVDQELDAEKAETYSEEAGADAEDDVVSFHVTLDANGGFFENEWDDDLGDVIESTENLNMVISAGEAVTVFPVYEKDDKTAVFLGWSLERDGELVSQEYEEFVPGGDCILYAAWNITEPVLIDEEKETDAYDEASDPVQKSEISPKDDAETDIIEDNSDPTLQESTEEAASNEEESISSEAVYNVTEIPEDAEYWCGHYYRAYPLKKTPLEAKAYCESIGGYLATVNNYRELLFINSIINSYSGYSEAIIGGTDEDEEGVWTWLNGEEWIYARWGHRYDGRYYPDNRNGRNFQCNYLGIHTSGFAHDPYPGFFDINGDEKYGMFICEWGNRVDIASLSDDSFELSKQKHIYNGSAQKPDIKVFYNGNKDIQLEEGYDYTYRCFNNVNIGTATVQINGVGRYTGSSSFNYYVVPPKPDSVTLMQDVDHRSVTVSWETVKNAKGYILEYSTDRNFQWNVTTVQPEEIDACEYITPPLQGKTTYYFRVCAAGDLNDKNCVSDWSSVQSMTTVSGLWMTIFSNQKTDAGHAFLNVENCTDEDVFIGPFELAAGDNAYISGRGVIFESIKPNCPVKQSDGGAFINFESVYEKEKGETIYKDFAWYTVSIDKEDLETLYNCMKDYGTYNLFSNNCTHFASKTWNKIVDDKCKVCETGLPYELKKYITDVLKGKTATELRIDDKDLTDVYLMDSNGNLMPYTLHRKSYFNGINSLKVAASDPTSVTLKWSSPAEQYRNGKYNITNLFVKYTTDGKSYKTISAEPNSTGMTIGGLTPETGYSFKLYGISDHRDTKTGIVTGDESTVKCEATTGKAVQVTKVSINKTSINLATTSAIKLTATPSPTDATDKTITWSSSDPSIASVDKNGLVKALKYGTAIITARSSNGKTATCRIQTRFNDVNNTGKSYYTPVYWAVDNGITACTVSFRPDDSVTRGEFVAFLWRMAGKPKSVGRVSFNDVNSKTKFYDAIRWAVGKGIIKGYSDGTFKSDKTVTRGETAVMIWRYAGRPAPKTKKSPFSDIKASSADSYKAILWGSENGIIKGSNGKFLKDDGCTRGQVVTFLYRYEKKFR